MSRLPVQARVGLWLTFTAVCFALMVAGIRQVAEHLDVLSVAFWRNVFAALTLAPWLLHNGLEALATRRPLLHATRSLFMVGSQTALYVTMIYMPLADATALSFTTPLFAAVLVVVLLKERMPRLAIPALGLGFLGVLVILRPGVETLQPIAGLALLSALLFGFVIVTGKALARTEGATAMIALLALFSLPLSFCLALPGWSWPAGEQWLWLAATGLAANGNMYGLVRAYKIADAAVSLPFDFLRLPFVALFGYLLFGQQTDLPTWIGAGIVVAGSLLMTRRGDTEEAGT